MITSDNEYKTDKIMIKIGDRVKFINDVGVGTVQKIVGTIVTVDREDGFEVPALISELVVVDKAEEMRAISKIGVSDLRPGRVKRSPAEKAAVEESKKLKACVRYGRVSLVEDYEDDEPIDLISIKESYTRNMANVNSKLLEVNSKLENDTSIFDEVLKKVEVDPIPEVAPVVEEIVEEVKVEAKPIKAVSTSGIDVVDLHAHEILETEQGMSPGDILNYQVECFTKALDSKIASRTRGKIVFIHGVGSGKLKYEITKVLKSRYPKIYFQDASFKEYGYGAIMVIV